MLIVHRCKGWATNHKKVHDHVKWKTDGPWMDWTGDPIGSLPSFTFTDTICPQCQAALEELYNRPLEELIDDAKDLEKAAKEQSEKDYDDFVERTIDQHKEEKGAKDA
jgi:hypothetical protein